MELILGCIGRACARPSRGEAGRPMPFAQSIERAQRLLVIRGSGVVSIAECVEAGRRAIRSVADGDLPTGYGVLVDVDAVQFDPTDEETNQLTRLVELMTDHLQGSIAIVSADVGNWTTAHVVAVGASGVRGSVRAFAYEPHARSWLGERDVIQ
jgi:hypothetical protein